jgi:hypothetical protein
MNETHEPFCDRNHTPRQRCNRALGLDDNGLVLDPEPLPQNDATPLAHSAPDGVLASPAADEPRVDLTRETMATVEMPAPTEFVSREWSKTADAVERAHRPEASEPPARRRGPGPTIALAGAAVSLVLLLLYVAQRRARSSQ